MNEHCHKFTCEELPLFLCDLKSIVDLPTSIACYKYKNIKYKIHFLENKNTELVGRNQ